MTRSVDDRMFVLAELLGAVQEARRLRHRLVGSEHVLMASLSDPTVRSALKNVGCDLRDVQALVTRTGRSRQTAAAGTALTDRAADLLDRATARVPASDLESSLDPRLLSMALGAVMVTLLHDEHDTAARRILAELGIPRHAARLTEVIEQNAGSAFLPRHD